MVDRLLGLCLAVFGQFLRSSGQVAPPPYTCFAGVGYRLVGLHTLHGVGTVAVRPVESYQHPFQLLVHNLFNIDTHLFGIWLLPLSASEGVGCKPSYQQAVDNRFRNFLAGSSRE